MSLQISVVWGGEWAVGQRLTPTLLNGIFQNAQFQISGSITTATKPDGGIDYTWIGNTFLTGLTAATPAGGDVMFFWDISAGAHKKATITEILALGFSSLASVASVAATDEAVVIVSSTQKRVTIRKFGEAAVAYLVADTAAASAGALSLTDLLIGSKGGTQGKATLLQVFGALASLTNVAAEDVDLDDDRLVLIRADGSIKKTPPRGLQSGLSAYVYFDGRTGTGAVTSIPGQNLTGPTSDAVGIAATHGITTGQVRQAWWTGTIPLISTPQMVANTPYWIRSLGATSLAFYATKADAQADTNRITLASDNGSSGWVIYFWETDPTTNSGGTLGVLGVVILNMTDSQGTRGKYRIFYGDEASLTHPVCVANAKYHGGDDSPFVIVRETTTTYADIWVQGEDTGTLEANPLNAMIMG